MKMNTTYVILMVISLVWFIIDMYDGTLSKILVSGLFFVSFLLFWLTTLISAATGLKKVARIILIVAILLLAYSFIQSFNIHIESVS